MDEQVDEFYFSALSEDNDLIPISDEKYADQLQLQEVLVSSVVATINRYGFFPAKNTRTSTRIKTEPAESSSRISAIVTVKTETFCKICMEAFPTVSMFTSLNCSHSFCRDCFSLYISTKIKENISAVKCPEEKCRALLEPEQCQEIIPKQVFDRWENALHEAMILGSNKYSYCPFKDCSALLLADEQDGESVDFAECPSCRRLFCDKCSVAWHSGVSCEEFQRLGAHERESEDLKLIEIAKIKKWKRCPQCKFYVEKTQGCLHVTCRCSFEFCYGCGKKWSETHASCQ